MCRARLPVPLSSLEGSGICEPSLNIRLTCFMWSAMAQTTPFEVFRSKPYVILPVFGSICSSALGKTSRTSFRKHNAISRASRLYEAKKASSWLHMAVLWRNIVGSVLKCTFVVVSPRGFGVCFSRGVLRFSSALCLNGFLGSQPISNTLLIKKKANTDPSPYRFLHRYDIRIQICSRLFCCAMFLHALT